MASPKFSIRSYLEKWLPIFSYNEYEKIDDATFRDFTTDNAILHDRGPNALQSGTKFVEYLTAAEAVTAQTPDLPTLDKLDPLSLCIGTSARVSQTAAGIPQWYKLELDTTPQVGASILRVFNDGDFNRIGAVSATSDGLRPAKWVKLSGSEAQQLELTADMVFPLLQEGAGITITLTKNKRILISTKAAAALTDVAQPPAPTSPDANDTYNYLSGIAVPGYLNAIEYEGFGWPGVDGWAPFTTKNSHEEGGRIFQDGLTGPIALGMAGFRVAASGNRPAGKTMTNNREFTGPAVALSNGYVSAGYVSTGYVKS